MNIIKLGKGVVELGGLVVIGTERMESQRIDLQIRGRSGRQVTLVCLNSSSHLKTM
ncbi:MAG: hypothetical protein ACLS5K_04665 [Streptococcus salivarius]